MQEDKKGHWDKAYVEKSADQMSWTQDVPKLSIDLITGLNLSKDAGIIDVGGGDSKLVDYLLNAGYTNLTVVDISAAALERAQIRLGEKSKLVNWVVSDITNFVPQQKYQVWYDRAAFHFLTEPYQIGKYLSITAHAVIGYLIIGVFSETGPEKCSGLPVKRYSAELLENAFSEHFFNVYSVEEKHITPFNTSQDFVFCTLKKRS